MAPTLRELCLEITNLCQMNCMHCSANWRTDPLAELDSRTAIEVIDDFARLGGRLLEVSGGEPLLHDELFKILSHAKSRDLEVQLYTSGVGKGTPISLTEANMLESMGVDKVIFGLQGATATTHDAITSLPRSFETTITSIRNIRACGIWTGVHFVPMKLNINGFEDLVKLCHLVGADEIAVLRFVPQGNGRINRAKLELSREESVRLIKDILDLRKEYGDIKIRTGCPLNFAAIISHDHVEPCKAGKHTCVVKPNGDVIPCPAFKQDDRRVMGNITVEMLSDIWKKSPRWKEFREFDPGHLNEPCKSCEELQVCAGRCAAQRILNLGDIYSAPDPMCLLHEKAAIRAGVVVCAQG